MDDIKKQIGDLVESGDLPAKIEMPAQIVDGIGQGVANPNILEMGDLPFILQLAQLGQAVKMRKLAEETARRRFFKGDLETLNLAATEAVQETSELPSLVSAFIINYGPNAVYIAINSGLNKPLQILNGESRTLSYADAEKRIEKIYYWCNTGETAALRVEGYY
jgi:hypothetical protein